MKQHGFTLIELLVAIGILLLLIGLGLASFISFNDRQKLIQAQELVREAVAEAQNAARSGKMRGCDKLSQYELVFSGSQITIIPECANGGTGERQDIDLNQELIFTVNKTNTPLFIAPVTGAITSANNPPFEVYVHFSNNPSLEAGVEIDQTGAVRKIENN